MPKTGPFDEYTDEYDDWYDRNMFAYQSELEAIRQILPPFEKAVEIGVGTGRFAAELGVTQGVEPSSKMAAIAKSRGIEVKGGRAESLPFDDSGFDLVLMVTVVCFLDDIAKAFSEAYRILKPGGHIVVGFIDLNSPLGKVYDEHKTKSPFFGIATFHSGLEIARLLNQAGFKNLEFKQTIFNSPEKITAIEMARDGHGEGLFVVVKGLK
jgi:ubiquinone/menaquinone biosynthesis C-methylase UbiE